MAIERERKFLVDPKKLPSALGVANVFPVVTGYFTRDGVAIRVSSKNMGSLTEKCKICFKGPGSEQREEFEYTIPNEDARALLRLAPTQLMKYRFELDGWEIDSIDLGVVGPDGSTKLWMAEWEEHPGKSPLPSPLPEWIFREVTEEPREYSNQAIAWKYGRKAIR